MRILPANKFHPYKARMLNGCHILIWLKDVSYIIMGKYYDPFDQNFLKNLLFCSYSTFVISRNVNWQNCKYWLWKIIWVKILINRTGIISDRIVSTLLIEENKCFGYFNILVQHFETWARVLVHIESSTIWYPSFYFIMSRGN